jgi:hypothetical protein
MVKISILVSLLVFFCAVNAQGGQITSVAEVPGNVHDLAK